MNNFLKYSMKMRKVIVLMALLLGFNSVIFSQREAAFTADQKFMRTLFLLRNAYVDTVDVDKSVEIAIIKMLENLDPHSVYMNPDEVKRSNEPLQGNFEGIGVQFQIIRDTVNVVAVIAGGPSEQVGLLAGDKIVSINDEEATGSKLNNAFIFERLRGVKGSKVKIGIVRHPSVVPIYFEIIRDKIPLHSVDASYMIDNEIAYIKINRFSSTTVSEFEEAVNKMNKGKFDKLIIDLRGNSGGFLNTAIELTDHFFEKGKLIVYTEGRNSNRENSNSTSRGLYKKGKLVVLIDQGSASASEIFAGAIQDWDRGVVIGRRTFGKGLVQRRFPMPDGSEIRLTTSRYHTPSGRSIQKPYDDDKKKYLQELNQRLENGELLNFENVQLPDSMLFKTSVGRKVYGGGGVMPDIFVPIDTSRLDDYYLQMARTNVFSQFVADYLQKNRNSFQKRYSNVNELKTYLMNQSDDLVQEIIDYAANLGVEKSTFNERSEEFLIHIIIGQIARGVFDQNAYYQVVSSIDKELLKAIEVLKDEKSYNSILK